MFDLDEARESSALENYYPQPNALEVPSADVGATCQGAWLAFGFALGEAADAYILPPSVIAFEAAGIRQQEALNALLQTMELRPSLSIKLDDQLQVFFRLGDASFASTLARSLPEGIRLVTPGESVTLPSRETWQPQQQHAAKVDELSQLTAVEVSRIAKLNVNPLLPAVTSNPLIGFSLQGSSTEFRAKAVAATPLLANLCLSGQVTVWYAAPNTGKTLIALNLLIDAIKAGRIAGGNVFYLNADDNSEGMATKMELMDDLGVHTLVPGFKGFRPIDLLPRLLMMAENDEARGVFILVDTTKKFTSLMDKKESSNFGMACRRVAMAGGAVLNLAHTTKRPNADGTPCYAGTSDLVDDADAAYTIRLLEASGEVGESIVEFNCFKQRGDNDQTAAYAYAAETGVSYPERLASVRLVDPATVDEFKRVEEQKADEDVVEAIAASIAEGFNTKMVLGKEAAARAGVAVRLAHRLIEKYTGEDPELHRWRFVVRERGAKTYELLPPPG